MKCPDCRTETKTFSDGTIWCNTCKSALGGECKCVKCGSVAIIHQLKICADCHHKQPE